MDDGKNDEKKWINEVLTGDKTKFNNIINKYHKRILNYFYRFTFNQVDSEDLTQELFLRVFNNLKNYNPEYSFSTWIYTIAYNLAIDFKRIEKHNPVLSFDGSTKEEEIIRAETQDNEYQKLNNLLENKELEVKAKNALMNLPENQKMAIILRIYEEKSYQEISEIMDISKSAVESLLFRARENLKNKLK